MRLRPKMGSISAIVVLTAMFSAPFLLAQGTTDIERGKEVYDTYCVVCHGDKGDGKGLMGIIHRAQQNGIVIPIYPRDFTAGVFKFRSTPTGDLPIDADLKRIITNGIPRSGMPSHADLSEEKVDVVVAYIKSYSPRWSEEEQGIPIEIGSVPSYLGTEQSIDRGKKNYADMKCWECHGETGLGDGPASGELKDDWGDKSLPFDFTSGPLKGGNADKDLLRTFITGLDGTPMPSYHETIKPEQQWDLVSYCLYLMKGGNVETATK